MLLHSRVHDANWEATTINSASSCFQHLCLTSSAVQKADISAKESRAVASLAGI